MRTIYVAGYPRSGTTWLTRLLGDALNCPTGGPLPEMDAIEPATEGRDRPGPYVVRKGHFRLSDENAQAPVPQSHTLAYKALTDEGVVWIHRHTFDVILSVRDYWNRGSIEGATMHLAGKSANVYVNQVQDWLDAPFEHARTSYEALYRDTQGELARILRTLDLPVDERRLSRGVRRQSVAVRRRHARIYGDGLPQGREYHERFYPRGKPGQWRAEFTEQDVDRAVEHFGVVMARLGYSSSERAI